MSSYTVVFKMYFTLIKLIVFVILHFYVIFYIMTVLE